MSRRRHPGLVDLSRQVVVVTGASHGIGRAVASKCHGAGARVGLLARSTDELEEAKDELGNRVAVATGDVTDRHHLEASLAELERALGAPTVLVNNAGVGAYAAVMEEDPGTFERLMAVNYLGTVHATRAVLPAMARRGHGHIVNIASVAGRVGAPFEAAYSASKFAVVGFSEALTAEVAPLGIKVSLINPGPVTTRFTEARGVPFQRKVPRPIDPGTVASAVVDAVRADRFEQTLPRWLRSGSIVRALAPQLYRRGLLASTSGEARQLAERLQGSDGAPRG
jgi:short-subunit dehydrogenase